MTRDKTRNSLSRKPREQPPGGCSGRSAYSGSLRRRGFRRGGGGFVNRSLVVPSENTCTEVMRAGLTRAVLRDPREAGDRSTFSQLFVTGGRPGCMIYLLTHSPLFACTYYLYSTQWVSVGGVQVLQPLALGKPSESTPCSFKSGWDSRSRFWCNLFRDTVEVSRSTRSE